MTTILLLVVVIGFSVPIGRYVTKMLRRRRREERFRKNPPELERFVARLPMSAVKSNEAMIRFFSRLDRVVHYDEKAIATGENVTHFTLLVTASEPGQPPKVSYVVHAPKGIADAVRREMEAAYGDELQILNFDEKKDPFLDYDRKTRAVRAWEDQQTSLSDAEDEPSDVA